MSKSLGRLDAVRDAKADLDTQTATVTFKAGRPVDFRALAEAVDRAGFKAGTITIKATGRLAAAGGGLRFSVSGSGQTFALVDGPGLARLRDRVGQDVTLEARVRFEESPAALIVEEPPPAGGRGGMKRR